MFVMPSLAATPANSEDGGMANFPTPLWAIVLMLLTIPTVLIAVVGVCTFVVMSA